MLLPEGGDDPARHAVRARAEGARLRDRHAPSLPRDVRVLARRRAALRHDDRGLRGPAGGGARGRARRAALGAEARPLPLDRQGRAARPRARRARRLDHRASAATSRRRAPTRRSSAGTSSTSSGRRTRSRTGPTRCAGTTSARASLPYNPLHDQGYDSIGDTHSTQPGSGRSGRWAGTGQGRVRHPHGSSADVAELLVEETS